MLKGHLTTESGGIRFQTVPLLLKFLFGRPEYNPATTQPSKCVVYKDFIQLSPNSQFVLPHVERAFHLVPKSKQREGAKFESAELTYLL